MKGVFLLLTFFLYFLFTTSGLAISPFYVNEITDTLRTSFKKRGFVNITQVAFDFDRGTKYLRKYHNSQGLQTIIGFQSEPKFFWGVGVGADIYRDNVKFPVFIDFRTYLLSRRVSPLASLDIGYALGGGPFVTIDSGVKCFVSHSTSLLICLGYRVQKTGGASINTINVKIGASF